MGAEKNLWRFEDIKLISLSAFSAERSTATNDCANFKNNLSIGLLPPFFLCRVNQYTLNIVKRKRSRLPKEPASPLRSYACSAGNYSAVIAPVGQAPSQAPQSMQEPASTTATPPSIATAPTGQAPSQAPQPTQASETLCAIILTLLSTRAKRILRGLLLHGHSRPPGNLSLLGL